MKGNKANPDKNKPGQLFGSYTNSRKPGGLQRVMKEDLAAYNDGGHDKVHDAPKKKKMGKPT